MWKCCCCTGIWRRLEERRETIGRTGIRRDKAKGTIIRSLGNHPYREEEKQKCCKSFFCFFFFKRFHLSILLS